MSNNCKERLKLNEKMTGEIMSLSDEIASICGENLSEMILYGSYARGEQTEESDIDIALLVNRIPSKDVLNSIINAAVAHEIECGKVFSLVDIEIDKYIKWKNVMPFYRNIEKEGISLWKRS